MQPIQGFTIRGAESSHVRKIVKIESIVTEKRAQTGRELGEVALFRHGDHFLIHHVRVGGQKTDHMHPLLLASF